MPYVRASAAALLVCALAAAQQISPEEYKTRRAELRKSLADSVFIAFGATESDGGNVRSGFFQNPSFFYLTGWNEPGAILVITPASEALLIPKRNAVQERWTGPKLDPSDSDARERTGFDTVLPAQVFESRLAGWLAEGSRLFAPRADIPTLQRLAPLRTVSDATLTLARQRSIKSPAEIAAIQRSVDATIAAHRTAWSMIKQGLMEYEVAAAMSATYFAAGCARHAYAPIVGSGPNGAVLHYSRNDRRMDSGELLLMDVGAECAMYAADITRTVPVNGKWSQRQRELYEIVLGAQKAALAAVKPGATMARTGANSVYNAAFEYLNTHGKDLKGEPLGKYFIHGLGHSIGLEVHDAFDPAQPLAEGMVITLEPGLYIPEEKIGIRIEDVVLVTANGARVLSSALPKEAAEVERALARVK